MDVTKSILADVREGVGLSSDTTNFDVELLMHINNAIGRLSQNGVGNPIVVRDDTTTWNDLMNPEQVEGNKLFHMVPLFVTLSTKIIFDPPPPSAVPIYTNNLDESLWRLKAAYETPAKT